MIMYTFKIMPSKVRLKFSNFLFFIADVLPMSIGVIWASEYSLGPGL